MRTLRKRKWRIEGGRQLEDEREFPQVQDGTRRAELP